MKRQGKKKPSPRIARIGTEVKKNKSVKIRVNLWQKIVGQLRTQKERL